MSSLTHQHLTGSLVALVTPMDQDGDIDYEALGQLIDWHIEAQTDGLVVMGTTGEASLVSEQEFIQVIEFAAERLRGKLPLILGVGSPSTQKALDWVDRLNSLAPAAYLCVTPYYVKPTQAGLCAHFTALADRATAPILLYNVPSRTGVDLADDAILELAKHPNIVGIKDATGDIARASQLFSRLNDFVFLSGDDETAFQFIAEGGHGVISVTANVAPVEMRNWIHLLMNKPQNSLHQAREIFERLLPLHRFLFVEANPIPVKWALIKMNKINTGIRLPLTLPSAASQRLIEEAMAASGIAN